MGEDLATLASILKAEGYATGAIVNAPYLKGHFGVDKGFDLYYMTPPEGRLADGTTTDALKWIDENRDRPFFMFAHYFDPHLPYGPPAPYDSIFDPGYKGRISSPYNPQGLPRFRTKNFVQMESLSPADWNHIRSLYDGEIGFTDEAIGALLAGLEERGLLGNTLIVFLSDHGEEFFEHHGFEHGHSLFDELIRVPMVFSLPGVLAEDMRVTSQVRLLDVEPTILDLLGIEPPEHIEGVSLLPLMNGGGRLPTARGALLPPEIAYSEALLYGQERKSLSAYPWKLIYNIKTDEIILFNLAEDPGELENLADQSIQSRDLLEEALYRVLFDISDTWFLEMAGGQESHEFDLRIKGEVIRGAGTFSFHRMIDSHGNIFPTDKFGMANITRSAIDIQNLEVKDPLTLAFKPGKNRVPIVFDLWIDGKPAIRNTSIGRSLSQPVTMPFTEQIEQGLAAAEGEPDTRPRSPYCLVWLYRSGYREGSPVELDEETKQELRSLGYIQ
jgi:hypothetical protein